MTALTGLRPLLGLILRRDRWLLLGWIALVVLYLWGNAQSTFALYPTEAARALFASEAMANPAQVALRGRIWATSPGALVAWPGLAGGALLIGLASLMLIIRHTRVEEEQGRAELLGAAPIGCAAPLTAALVVVAGANLVAAGLTTVALLGSGLPPAGAVALPAALAAIGLVFAATGAVVAQVTTQARAARRLGIISFAVAYVLHGLGDITPWTWLGWLTPFGWANAVRPFANERWWPLGLLAALSLALGGLALWLAARRDVGAGLWPARPGAAQAPAWLASPLALGWRVHRGAIGAWVAGFAALGLLSGASLATVNNQLPANFMAIIQEYANVAGNVPGNLVALNFLWHELGYIVGAAAIAFALHLRAEETAGTAAAVLAAPVSRRAFALSQMLLTFLAPVAMLAALGALGGLAFALIAPALAPAWPRAVLSALAMAPAVWVMATLTYLLIGWAPRAAAAAWGLWLGFILLELFGPALGPGVARLIFVVPFAHAPWTLIGDTTFLPLIWLTLVAVALAALALVGYQRRDIG